MDVRLSTGFRNRALDAGADPLGSGYLRFYTNPRRATPDAVVGTAVLLAELRLSSIAFAPAANGTKVANAIVQDSAAKAAGTATWCTLVRTDGTTAEIDGDVGLVGSNSFVEMPLVALVTNLIVACSSLTITLPNS